ncbi:hypothetical protein K3495_g13422 [Podosphaera aphanis]|nr:hypothetical protein K3495_g13422 [Podosphaera aphanis]
MNSNPDHGSRISNFSSQSPHRMPTVSAAQALEDLKCSPGRCISTGVHALDAYLQNKELSEEDIYGGISRGQVTDIHGPPGVGKTAFAMQLAASVLHAGEGVVWVDATQKIPGPRFAQILTSFKPIHSSQGSPDPSLPSMLSRYTHFSTPTLAHLIALLSHFTTHRPPTDTSLIVIDSLSTLTTAAFPREIDLLSTESRPIPNSYSRKFPILQFLISSLQKIAATRNIAVFITLQCVTKISLECGAVLVPAINTAIWEQGIRCRLILFRDWGWRVKRDCLGSDVRVAKVIKAEGFPIPEELKRLVWFTITETGIVAQKIPDHPLPAEVSPSSTSNTIFSLPLKRKFLSSNIESLDSVEEDESYGWSEEDEQDLPTLPRQWQGSDDLLASIETEEKLNEGDKKVDLRLNIDEPGRSLEKKPALIENSESDDELIT